MLAEFGCAYVLVGHSERRTYHGETDATVAAKALRALESGIVPVVCVGETLAEREAGQTEAVVGRQLQAVLDALSIEQLDRIVLAYEPVWAIGTGTGIDADTGIFILCRRRALGAIDIAAGLGRGGPVGPG